MFIKEMCKNQCSRLFRPWDVENQDSTVSTTTQEETGRVDAAKVEIAKTIEGSGELKKEIPKTPVLPLTQAALERVPAYPPDYTLFHEYPQTNNIQHSSNAGNFPNDPVLLESLAHGYAFEEYARVLEQEHQAKLLNAKKKRPKKYKCPHCDVGFSNNGQLKGHIRIHTGERPFKCDEKDCGKTFTRNEELTRHKRIHSGLRPYPCSQCGKRFGRKDHLKKHCRTHFQPRGFYAVPVMLPYEAWAANYTFGPPIHNIF